MRNLAPSGGTSTPAEAHVCDLPAGLCAPLTSPPPAASSPPDPRAHLDALDALARTARAAADSAATSADAAEAARAEAFALYHAMFGPPELAPGPDGRARRNPAALAFHAAAAAEEADAEARTPGLLDKPAAAGRLGISVRSLERLVSEGRVRAVRISARCVRFDGAALDAFARASARTRPSPRPAPRKKPAPVRVEGRR